MTVIDFNSLINFGQITFVETLKGLANAHRANCFLTTDRLSAKARIRQMRSPIPRQLSDKNFFLPRSVSLYGFCTDNISTESSRHRNLFASNAIQTLPLWHPRKNFSQHPGKGKRESRLANICRLRASVNKHRSKALYERRLRRSTEASCLRSGFNNHRFMSVTFSMGKVSQTQSRSQSTHVNGPERLYTLFYPHYRRKSTRCKHPRRTGFGTWFILHNGPRLHRLRSPLYIHSKPFILYYKSQEQFRLSSPLLSQSQQDHRFAMRPDDKAQRLLCIEGLPCSSSPNQLLRCRDQQKISFFNKQLYAATFNNRSTLQMPLANRNFLQMDQAVFAYQNIFRHYRKRGKDSNLDCHQCLRSRSNYQERTRNRVEFGRNLANSQHCTFRESTYYTSTYEKSVAKRIFSVS